MPAHFWWYFGLAIGALILAHLINSALDALFMDSVNEKIKAKMQG